MNESSLEPAPGPQTPPDGAVCAPVVHGCGCAYVCGLGQPRPDGNFDVTHDFQDSRIDVCVRERRCFDPAGVSYHEPDAPPEATRCLDVFYDQTPCGGECIPTTEYLDCVFVGGSCRPG